MTHKETNRRTSRLIDWIGLRADSVKNKNNTYIYIGPMIRIGRKIQCLPYAGFLWKRIFFSTFFLFSSFSQTSSEYSPVLLVKWESLILNTVQIWTPVWFKDRKELTKSTIPQDGVKIHGQISIHLKIQFGPAYLTNLLGICDILFFGSIWPPPSLGLIGSRKSSIIDTMLLQVDLISFYWSCL